MPKDLRRQATMRPACRHSLSTAHSPTRRATPPAIPLRPLYRYRAAGASLRYGCRSVSNRTSDTPRPKLASASSRRSTDRLSKHRLLTGIRRCAVSVRSTRTSFSELRAQYIRHWRSLSWAAATLSPVAAAPSVGSLISPEPDRLTAFRKLAADSRADLNAQRSGRPATVLNSREHYLEARHSGALRARRNVRADQGAPHDAGVRQYPQSGGRHLSGSLALSETTIWAIALHLAHRRGAAAQG